MYLCEECGRAFTRKDNMLAHCRSETRRPVRRSRWFGKSEKGEYICGECQRTYQSYGALHNHYQAIHTQTTGSSVNNATRASTEVTISCATCWNTSNAIVNEQWRHGTPKEEEAEEATSRNRPCLSQWKGTKEYRASNQVDCQWSDQKDMRLP